MTTEQGPTAPTPRQPSEPAASVRDEELIEATRELSRRRTRRWLLMGLTGLVLAGLLLGPGAARLWNHTLAAYAISQAESAYWRDDLAVAIAQSTRAIDLVPEQQWYRIMRAQYLSQANRLQESLDDFDAILKSSPNYADGHSGRGSVLQKLGRMEEAVAAFQEARRLRSDEEPRGWNDLAYSRAVAGEDLEMALEEAEKAIALDEARIRGALIGKGIADGDELREKIAELEDPTYRDTLGYVKFKMGNLEEALADLNLAVDGQRRLMNGFRERAAKLLEMEGALGTKATKELSILERELGILLYHRSQVHAASDQKDEAAQDLAESEKLGYDPARGEI